MYIHIYICICIYTFIFIYLTNLVEHFEGSIARRFRKVGVHKQFANRHVHSARCRKEALLLPRWQHSNPIQIPVPVSYVYMSEIRLFTS